MLIIKPSYEILGNHNSDEILEAIEEAGRTCYKSDRGDTRHFVDRLIRLGHHSVLEHQSISVRIICDRGVSHELVRHRIASYSQESTRFCNYAKKDITFILPCWIIDLTEGAYEADEDVLKESCCPSKKWMEILQNVSSVSKNWLSAMLHAENSYLTLLKQGWQPQQARSVLPNSLKTEIVMTQNLRQWRHFFAIRAVGVAGKPHPQMLELTVPMLKEFQQLIPIVFDDLAPKED